MWMSSTPCPNDVTQLVQAWGRGEQTALQQLVPLVYSELHRLAHRFMKGERAGHGLQTTALINEAYLRLLDAKLEACPGRSYFFGVCARLMRQILVDWARSQQSLKRQGDLRPVELNEALAVDPSSDPSLVAVDDALNALAALDPRKAEIVELRFFGGLTIEETAEALNISVGTVSRDWGIARTFLHRQLSGTLD
jgi:RNA polymerase sigma-70 factor (ECF subfamily)